MDIVAPETRSRMMAGIQGKNTKPEMLLRSQLHKKGFRFRVHDKKLPGKPDIVLKKHNAVIFTHGCFWHRHNCHLFKWPKTRTEFWRKKLNYNHENDQICIEKLLSLGWRVCIVWECAVKGKNKDITEVISSVVGWLLGKKSMWEISG